MKKCTRCKILKDESEFFKDAQKKSGLRSYCKDCAANYRINWYQKNRKNQLMQMKEQYQRNRILLFNLKSNGCAMCGYAKCSNALEFHHTNPKDKKFNLSTKMWWHSNNEIAEETTKCILFCANCHREKHSGDINEV